MAPASSLEFILPLVFILLCLICLARGIVWFLSDAGRHPRMKGRLKAIMIREGAASKRVLLETPVVRTSILEQTLKKFRLHQQLQMLLLQADLGWSLGSFLFVALLCGGSALTLGFLKWGPAGGLIGGGLGCYLPYKVLVVKRKRRLHRVEKQLPDALDLLARSLKAGHGFPAGMQLVAKEMPAPLGVEFFKAYKEYNHGLELTAALLNMCARIGLRDLEFFTTAVMIQRDTGGNLAVILEKISALVRERFVLRNQIRALTAEGRLSGVILILLPPVLAAILIFINPKYEMQLIQHPVGRVMASVALGFQAIGMWMIHRIVNIKV